MKPLSANEPKGRRARANDTFARTMVGLGRLVEAVTPWLLDLGNWIYGGLIAFSLIILGSLLTVGPVDVAVKVATACFALALPLDITGFVLLRLFADMTRVSLTDLGTKAFEEAGFRAEPRRPFNLTEARLRSVALRYSYGVLGITALLTLGGMTAALWHIGWWIGIAFLLMVVLSQVVLVAAVSALGPQGRWTTPAGEVEPAKPRTDQEG